MVVQPIFILLLINQVMFLNCNYLEDELNYQKPKRERNNIVNKGVWVRSTDNVHERDKLQHFIFRENPLESENTYQYNFNTFDSNDMQESPFGSDFMSRQKRSTNSSEDKDNTNNKRENIKDSVNDSNESGVAIKKLINEIRPTSIFNDYPYEVANFLNNNRSFFDFIRNKIKNNDTEIKQEKPEENNNSTPTEDIEIKTISNDSNKNIMARKRSMQYDFEPEVIKKVDFTGDPNNTDDARDRHHLNGKSDNSNSDRKIDRNVFDKDNSEWHQNVPIPDVNVYKVVPKESTHKSKPVTERGLIKVLSMLTKSFKKIMRQHAETKDMFTKVNNMNDEITKIASAISSKFQDFDLKYLYLVKLHEKLKDFEAKMSAKDVYFKGKQDEIDKGLKEFENQQKKFLQQQKQFYNIQKLMLAQNEKINIKQNLIAKTQGEISHRQNNFARILKKAKQLYLDSRNSAITKLSSSIGKNKDAPKPHFEQKTQYTSTQSPEATTGSIKINLFSIPRFSRIQQDPDEFILKEKDYQAIDDLVYKYYFNNTFIDSVMKNQILNSFLGGTENAGNSHVAKTKRDNEDSTILLPIAEVNETKNVHHRVRRSNHHHNKHRNKRKNSKKLQSHLLPIIMNITDQEIINKTSGTPLQMSEKIIIKPNKTPVKSKYVKDDAFLTMARSFCNQIGQNVNHQTLYWCIEKALRRLQFLKGKTMTKTDKSTGPKPTVKKNEDDRKPVKIPLLHTLRHSNYHANEISGTQDPVVEPAFESTSTTQNVETTSPTTHIPQQETKDPELITTKDAYTNSPPTSNASETYFPSNEALESNLKKYELVKDDEGNVYYDGSLHASAILPDTESEGLDDIMPGLDSNSRLELEPVTFDVQAKRRAYVRKLNERIKMSLG